MERNKSGGEKHRERAWLRKWTTDILLRRQNLNKD